MLRLWVLDGMIGVLQLLGYWGSCYLVDIASLSVHVVQLPGQVLRLSGHEVWLIDHILHRQLLLCSLVRLVLDKLVCFAFGHVLLHRQILDFLLGHILLDERLWVRLGHAVRTILQVLWVGPIPGISWAPHCRISSRLPLPRTLKPLPWPSFHYIDGLLLAWLLGSDINQVFVNRSDSGTQVTWVVIIVRARKLVWLASLVHVW